MLDMGNRERSGLLGLPAFDPSVPFVHDEFRIAVAAFGGGFEQRECLLLILLDAGTLQVHDAEMHARGPPAEESDACSMASATNAAAATMSSTGHLMSGLT